MHQMIKTIVLSCVLFILNLKCVLLDKVNDNEDSKQKPSSSEDIKDMNQNNENNEHQENKLFEGEMDLNKLVNILFVGLVVVVVILKYISSKQSQPKENSNQKESNAGEDKNDIDDPDNKKLKNQYRNLKLTYFPAYFAAIFGDWLQGPYVYRLYSEYGFQENQIAILFLTGFGSSFTFGTFTGPLADKFGRKSMTQVFCFLYSLSCVIKFSSNFWILICGRICAGIATSLLFRYSYFL